MSIDKDPLDRLMDSRSPGDLFGKNGILSELTKVLAERALSTEMDVHLGEERSEEAHEDPKPPAERAVLTIANPRDLPYAPDRTASRAPRPGSPDGRTEQ